jgi:osmotically-inducible protein OsmY
MLISLLMVAWAAAAAQIGSDDWIYDQVRLRLAADRDVKGGAIQVEVKDGVVTLRGKIKEEKQKLKAERITRKVRGVKKVVNQLQVELTQPARPGA